MLASQRRLERKLKELSMTLDEERQTHTEQRDQVSTFTSGSVSDLRRRICRHQTNTTPPPSVLQLTLRVKALKRQVDEGETELERLEGLRRKAQRDMEEQTELKEALQTRVAALETDLK